MNILIGIFNIGSYLLSQTAHLVHDIPDLYLIDYLFVAGLQSKLVLIFYTTLSTA